MKSTLLKFDSRLVLLFLMAVIWELYSRATAQSLQVKCRKTFSLALYTKYLDVVRRNDISFSRKCLHSWAILLTLNMNAPNFPESKVIKHYQNEINWIRGEEYNFSFYSFSAVTPSNTRVLRSASLHACNSNKKRKIAICNHTLLLYTGHTFLRVPSVNKEPFITFISEIMDVLYGEWPMLNAWYEYLVTSGCTVPCWQMRARWIKHRESFKCHVWSLVILDINTLHWDCSQVPTHLQDTGWT